MEFDDPGRLAEEHRQHARGERVERPAVAERATAFGCRVLAVDPERVPVPPGVEAVWQMDRFSDLLAQSDEAEVAILFKEAGAATRISVRTKPGGVDATVLTGAFGGGGHARAAGATVQLGVEAAREAVLAEARRLADLVVR